MIFSWPKAAGNELLGVDNPRNIAIQLCIDQNENMTQYGA